MKITLLLFVASALLTQGLAQEITTSLKTTCGDAVESEFTQPVEMHEYIVSVNAGDKLKIAAAPVGDYLETAIAIYEPAGDKIASDFERKQTPVVETGTLSARREYKVYIFNYIALGDGYNPTDMLKPYGNNSGGRAGTYTALIGCTLRDGTEIQAGSSQ
jgi:hypothetical protein